MAMLEGKWIRKDVNSLETNGSKELQVKVVGAIERTATGINVATSGITNSMLAGSINDSKLATQYIKADGTRDFTGPQSMGGFRITSVALPVSDSDAANKLYVDQRVQGLDPKASCRLSSTVNLTSTYDAVGLTLTSTTNGSLTLDGKSVVSGNRVLIKDQTTQSQNGIYVVTTVGGTSTPWVLTRAADFDSVADGEITANAYTWVSEGNVFHDSGFVLTTDDNIILDTTALAWEQFTGAGQIDAGDGMYKTGNRLDVGAGDGITVAADNITVKIDGTTLAKGISGLKVATGGITGTELNVSVAGNGLIGGGGSALEVNVGSGITVESDAVTVKLDGSTLSKGAAGLKVSDGGIATAQIAQNAVTAAKIDPTVAGGGLVGGNGTALAVGAGDGITVNADTIAVKMSDLVDTTKGLAVVSNDVSVNLDASGGLEFNAGAIRLKDGVAGAGLVHSAGVLSINTGSGLTVDTDALELSVINENWNAYNGVTYYNIKGIKDPVDPQDAATKKFVTDSITAAKPFQVDTFTLGAADITNKFVTLAGLPVTASDVVILVKNAPNQFYGEDFQMDGTTPTHLTWNGMALDGLLEAGDKLTVQYTIAV